LQKARIFSASSLSDVIKQLSLYRLSGVLTIWPATGLHEEVWLAIDEGKPVYFVWNSYKENVNESTLTWFNSWGAIYFTFLASEIRLQLSAPAQQPQQERALPSSVMPPETSTEQTQGRQSSATPPRRSTTPLPAVRKRRSLQKPDISNNDTETYMQEVRGQESLQKPENTDGTLLPPVPETCVAVPTAYGRSYPIASLPRHDRTIFLLINGQRTQADLAKLTKRPVEDVFATLTRLEHLQLITIHT
jgi:hypothetical protein